jgi:methylisocitrate lyase
LFGHLDRMQTRAELYETIGYHDFEALDASVARTIVPDDRRTRN